MNMNFFAQRPKVSPTIYAYELVGVDSHKGYLKIGYTIRTPEIRVAEQMHTSAVQYKIVLKESAVRNDGSYFLDHDVHNILRKRGYKQFNANDDKNEWFKCDVKDVQSAIVAVREGIENLENRTQTFTMRPEQCEAVNRTIEYFTKAKKDEPDCYPKFLWNAKMRFGKTFATYQLAKQMNMNRILVITFKPAVENAWYEDLINHIDFEGWQFISNHNVPYGLTIDQVYDNADKSKPIVIFGSFQDLLGVNDKGGIKTKNEFIHLINFDMVVFDEYHFGAWRDTAKKLFDNSDEEVEIDFDQEEYKIKEAGDAYNESFLPITTDYYLFLSGTPFRAINSGEFIEEQIFNWTYSDEQQAKARWQGNNNPYISLPRMVMLTYQIPESIRQVAMGGEFNEFDLNVFFSAKFIKNQEEARFTYQNDVMKWLQLIRGSYLPSSIDDLKLGQDKRPPMPFSDTRLLAILNHTLWFLPNVASCYAMYNLLSQDNFFRDYKIIVAAGSKAGIGLDALRPVLNAMINPFKSKTITLTCGKLNTGVTVAPWTAVFMLRNLKSPETYFQTAFRVQSPWTIRDENGNQIILKYECYVFDFALDRALRQISDYSCCLNVNEDNPEKKVGEFINFLPVLAYDGSTMKQISAQDILDIAFSGTSATLLARRWESALLVNVDNDTLRRILANQNAMNALMNIEGFRSLNQDIETIINKSEKVKKAKSENNEKLTPADKEKISQEEKEYKSMRKQIQEKLIKFATRIPIFMYLTDYRERTLKDIVTQIEPGLFKKVTGLNVKDFELLCSLGVFNSSLMNDAIFKFKRYEDSSLSYTGIDKHKNEDVGGWDTAINRQEYEQLFYNQQYSYQSYEEVDSTTDDVVRKSSDADSTSFRSAFVTEDYGINSPIPYENNDYSSEIRNFKSQTENDNQFYLSNVSVGSIVDHKTLGIGVVTKLAKRHICILFKDGEKRFTVPDSFEEEILRLVE
ncbi:MAG: GIY-YIG nuclease family protein [Succinivibrionaceae bacterium]